MPTIPKRPNFFETEDGHDTEAELQRMELDAAFNTVDTYTANTVKYPTNRISFMEQHKAYLIAHPAINPSEYLSNLRLKTRVR